MSAIVVAGAAPAGPAGAIVGGRPATRPYRFMVSLQDAPNDRHMCGGSLIRRDVVLSAAHCVSGRRPRSLQVMIGSLRLSDPGRIIAVARTEIHEDYDPETSANDVALLFLARDARRRPLRLASAAHRHLWEPGDSAIAIGWGDTSYLSGDPPDRLHEVELPMVDDSDCARDYDNPLYGWDPTSMVCAGEDAGGKDTCYGDSGGPLMVENDAGRLIQVGAVSFGVGCAFPTLYGVYARVGGDKLRSWIADHV